MTLRISLCWRRLVHCSTFMLMWLWLPSPALASLDVPEVTRIIAYGLRAIETRALEPVSLSETTLEGLRGLATVEAGLTLQSDDKILSAAIGDHPIGDWPLPSSNTPEAWAALTMRVLQAAQTQSSILNRMDAETLYQAFFDSALSPLDPFSRYAGRAEAEQQQERRNGFGGIGIRYRLRRDHLEVTSVLEGTPAEDVGVEPGDRIFKIGETTINTLSRKAVHGLLRGPVDSSLRLALTRGTETRIVEIKRSLVSTPTAFLSQTGTIPHLKITRFSQQTVALSRRLIEEYLDTVQSRPPPGLILDLRGNPGGLLDQAVNLSDLFLKKGDIVSTRGRHPHTQQSYQATQTDVPGGDILNGLPILILIDGRTASAAEIVAAALQADGRAVVVGTTSYGKGTVQTVVAMPNGGEMTLTWSRFYTPSGYALHTLGVMPTVCTAEGRTTPEMLMHALGSGNLPAIANYSRWRSIGLADTEGRHALRRICPPEDHSNRDALDLDIAQAILQSPGAYRTALAALETTAASR
ncbi:MAG: PDZ domain-containing protein [Rhodospirillaceae bacterium]|nr:PDZ domain-containing protein [Rhodospirillaceae bacterium]